MDARQRANIEAQFRHGALLDPVAFGEHLATTLYVGAAYEDSRGDRSRLIDLRYRVLEAIADHSVPLGDVRGIVREIMPDGWQPAPDWQRYIEQAHPAAAGSPSW